MEIEEKVYSFNDVREGLSFNNDTYGVASYTVGHGIKKTFMSAPGLSRMEEPMIILEYADGVAVGRNMMYPSRLKVNDEIIEVTSGSSLHVEEKYRQYALGVNLMMFPTNIKRPLLYAGLSDMAEPLYKKLKYAVFCIPRMWQIRHAEPVLKSFGIKGALLVVAKSCINPFLSIMAALSKKSSEKLLKQYTIKVFKEVPQWAEDMVMADQHKYAELHDKKWMQWVLENNFFERKEDKQYFYGVYKDNNPVGFLLMAERNFPILGKNIDKCVYGYVLDWESVDTRIISELQLKKIAMGLFTKDVDIVQVDSLEENVRKAFKKFGFINHGYENIGFKDITKKLDKDWKEARNWRLRASYSDRPFY